MFNSVVEESCFKHLQDVIATSVCDVTFTAPFCHNQHIFTSLKWRLKSFEHKIVSQWERKVLPCFVAEGWGENVKIVTFSIRVPVQL